MRAFLAAAAFGCCLTLVLVSCEKPQPHRVGFIGGLSGRGADLGVAGRNGAMLAVEEVNAAGGIHGRPVELLVRDDEQNPETARRALRELFDQQVVAVIGPMTSAMAMVLTPLADAARIPLLSPTVTTTDLSGRDDYFLRIIATTAEYASKNASYQYRQGRRRIAAIYDMGNRAYTESWINHFRFAFEQSGGQIVTVKTFTSGATPSYAEICREVLASKPDSVQIAANAVDAALFAQQFRKLDVTLPLGLVEWASTERLIELGGSAVEGVLVGQFLDRSSQLPEYRRFYDAYRKRFGMEPGFAGIAGYDSVRVLITALKSLPEGGDLRSNILETSLFQGVQQQIVIDRFGDASRSTTLSVVRQGQFEKVE